MRNKLADSPAAEKWGLTPYQIDKVCELWAALEAAGGNIFTLTVIKEDGSVRDFKRARLGVKKGVKMTGHPLHRDTPAVRVCELMPEQRDDEEPRPSQFRTVRLDRVTRFKMGAFSRVYEVK